MSEIDRREYRTVALGGLLHDLGKYLQRGELGQLFRGKHPEVGADFVASWQEEFDRCVDATLLHTLVQHHHEGPWAKEGVNVNDIDDEHVRGLARLVSHADNFASSERGERAAAYQDFRTTALAPIFSHVRLLRDDAPRSTYLPHRPLGGLETEPPIFPRSGRESPSHEVNAHIRAFGNAFMELQRELDWTDFETVYAHLLNMLGRFTSCIASDTQSGVPDIALYDHLRVTSAIAAGLYRHHAVEGTLTDAEIRSPTEGARCALLVGDLSGIQDHLFDIATIGPGGVARRLRARSFYLQMLVETAALKMLQAFELPPANLLMASGGNVYVLVPYHRQTQDRIDRLRAEFDAWMLQQFHGELTLNLAWTPVADEAFGTGGRGEGFGAAMTRLHRRLATSKGRRLHAVLANDGQWREEGWTRDPFPPETSVCISCGRFPAERPSEPGGEADLCRTCDRDQWLGRWLPETGYVGFYDDSTKGDRACFDWSFAMAREPNELPTGARRVTRLNDSDLSPLADQPAEGRYIANHVPTAPDGALWTFADIAAHRQLDDTEAPSGLLAIVKADVDYLGQVFQDGLRRDEPPSYDTPSRIAALSRHLELFFSGWVEWLLRTEFPSVYSVYSGGDDMLLVAPRSQALSLVQRIREAFSAFTDNPELTLSAGIAVVKPRLPLAHTVEFADAALEQAKGDRREGRNRLCVLGQLVEWDDLPLIESAHGLLAEAQPPSAFLHRLIHFGVLWQQWTTEGDPQALRFHSLLAYQIKRNLEPGTPLFDWATRLVSLSLQDRVSEQARTMDYLSLIARWALLGRREARDAEDV
ncbi:MAG: type III-A CRISPR-associated protein Cas10/Csm1 [Salinibacter sp.]